MKKKITSKVEKPKTIKCSTKNKKKKSKRTTCNKVSGLEKRFEELILIKNGLNYKPQLLIEKITRFYDFFLEEYNLIIEIQGEYYHSDPRKYLVEDLNKMQLRNKKNDKLKREYAYRLGYNFIYIWESEINENIEWVESELFLFIEEIKNNKSKKPLFKNVMLKE